MKPQSFLKKIKDSIFAAQEAKISWMQPRQLTTKEWTQLKASTHWGAIKTAVSNTTPHVVPYQALAARICQEFLQLQSGGDKQLNLKKWQNKAELPREVADSEGAMRLTQNDSGAPCGSRKWG